MHIKNTSPHDLGWNGISIPAGDTAEVNDGVGATMIAAHPRKFAASPHRIVSGISVTAEEEQAVVAQATLEAAESRVERAHRVFNDAADEVESALQEEEAAAAAAEKAALEDVEKESQDGEDGGEDGREESVVEGVQGDQPQDHEGLPHAWRKNGTCRCHAYRDEDGTVHETSGDGYDVEVFRAQLVETD